MNRPLFHLIMVLFLCSACSPAAAPPTASPMPTSPASTPMPTSTHAPSPTAAPTATATPVGYRNAAGEYVLPSELGLVEDGGMLLGLVDGSWQEVVLPGAVSSIDEAKQGGWRYAEGSWTQEIVRNEKGEIPLDDGITVKLKDMVKVSSDGVLEYIGNTGPNPKVKKYSFPQIPEGDEYTVFVFEAFNAPNTDMSAYTSSETLWFWTQDKSTETVKSKFIYSTSGDNTGRLIVGIQHNVGDEIGGLELIKKDGTVYHKVFDINDPETLDLLPQ